MDHLYIKYTRQFSVLVLGTLIIAGIVVFITQGCGILTVHQEFLSYTFDIPPIAIRSDNKKWKKRYYTLLLFLCLYLPPKISILLGIQCLSFSLISYIIVLIFPSPVLWVFYLVKK